MRGEEEIDIELRLSCSALTEKSRNSSCPLNLFSCSETTIGDAESLNMGTSSGFFKGATRYMFSSPEVSDLVQAPKKKVVKEFREQDLLRRLMDGSRSSSSSEEENSVTSCSSVDCTLSLGMSNTVLFSEQQGDFKGLLMSPERNPLPAVAGDENTFAWMQLQDMFRRRRIVERRHHVVGLGSPGNEGTPSRSCISPKITNGDTESSYNTMAVPFSELSSTNNNIHGSQFYKSCWNTTNTSSNTTLWLLDSRQKLMGSKNILPSRNHPHCGTVFRSQVSARLPTNNASSTNYINNSYGGSSRVVQQQQQQKQKRNATSQDAKANSIVRECAKCKTTTTPLWRNGPKGAKSLCNACGIRYKKEERRAASAMAAAADQSNSNMNNNNATNIVSNEFVKASRSNFNVVDYS